MKKFLCIFLTFCLVFGLCACSKGATENNAETNAGTTAPAQEDSTKTLMVGYGRVDITPSYSVPLAGYGNTSMRMSNGFLNYIYATCIAITDVNDSSLLLITLDFTGMYTNIVQPLKDAITEATGVPGERILMNVTHVHSCPDMTNTKEPSIQKYAPELYAKVAEAAKTAMDDRSAATMEIARGESENLTFNRHYITTTGQLLSDNMSKEGDIIGHHHDGDESIQLLIFRRAAEDKKDILAMNWQGHVKMDSTSDTATGKANRDKLTSDGIGALRDYLEANTDYLFAFYLGAAGNMNTYSKIMEENRTESSKEFGQMLGDHVLDALKTTTPVNGTVIQESHSYYEAVVDHSEDHMVADARKVSDVWQATNNFTEAVNAAPGSGIISPYHASSIISRANNTEGTRKLELNAIRIGDVAWATTPFETFDVTGTFVKENSPYEMTFFMSMCNGANSYIAAEYAFDKVGTYEVHNRLMEKGTAEGVADQLVEMLKGLAD